MKTGDLVYVDDGKKRSFSDRLGMILRLARYDYLMEEKRYIVVVTTGEHAMFYASELTVVCELRQEKKKKKECLAKT